MPNRLTVAELEESFLRWYYEDEHYSIRGTDRQLHQLWDQWKAYGMQNGDPDLSSVPAPELLQMAKQRVNDRTAWNRHVEDEHRHLNDVRRRAQKYGALVHRLGSEQAALDHQYRLFAPRETYAQEVRRTLAQNRSETEAQARQFRSTWHTGEDFSPLGAAGWAAARSTSRGAGDAPPPYPGPEQLPAWTPPPSSSSPRPGRG